MKINMLFRKGGVFIEDNICWIWISRLENLNFEHFEILIKKYGNIRNIWNLSKNEIIKNNFLSYNSIKDLLCVEHRRNIEKIAYYIEKHNIKIINCFDNKYPIKLNFINDKPIVLYTKGSFSNINNESVRNSWQ